MAHTNTLAHTIAVFFCDHSCCLLHIRWALCLRNCSKRQCYPESNNNCGPTGCSLANGPICLAANTVQANKLYPTLDCLKGCPLVGHGQCNHCPSGIICICVQIYNACRRWCDSESTRGRMHDLTTATADVAGNVYNMLITYTYLKSS